MKKLLLGLFLVVSLVARCVQADNAIGSDGFRIENIFHGDQWEVTVNSGPMFSPCFVGPNAPTLNYVLSGIQLGWMINDVTSSGPFRGNWEMVTEIFGGGVFKGEGSYLAGLTLWFRYNFVPAKWRVVPYLQCGGGVVVTDIDGRLVGQDFNFNVDFGAGLRFLLSAKWSLNLEYRYQHVSNASLSDGNVGLNAHGPMLGMSYFF